MSSKLLTRLVIPLVIVAAGVFGARVMLKMAPSAARSKPPPAVTSVEVRTVNPTSRPAIVRATGTVTPARQVTITPEISGRVIWLSDELVPGGRFREGELLLRIDPRDYQLALDQEQGRIASAELELEQELGRQKIAEREWSILQSDEIDARKNLVLREPHLAAAQRNLEATKSAAARAKLNLSRTHIKAPFNASVVTEQVEMGQVVSPGAPVATLIGTDQFWVRVSVPVDKLQTIEIPKHAKPASKEAPRGSSARVRQRLADGSEVARDGRVLRLESQLDPATRAAQVLIGVDNPLDTADGATPLLPGAYVQVEIEGPMQNDVFVVPRRAVHEGDTVWVMGADDRLGTRRVRTVWSGPEEVYVRGELKAGDRIVLTPLSVPIVGMPLRVAAPVGPGSAGPSSAPSSGG